MLPKLAENPANKVVVVPTDYAGLAGVATTLLNVATSGDTPSSKPNGNGRPTEAPAMVGRTTVPSQPQALNLPSPSGGNSNQ